MSDTRPAGRHAGGVRACSSRPLPPNARHAWPICFWRPHTTAVPYGNKPNNNKRLPQAEGAVLLTFPVIHSHGIQFLRYLGILCGTA